MKSLSYSGRQSNQQLSFHQWSRSKLAQYFTPMYIANAIFKGLNTIIPKDQQQYINVIDPTAGNGRLLYPWKKAGYNIYAIELEKEAIRNCKYNLGNKACYEGDLLEYAPFLRTHNFDIAILNPPFGLSWDTNNIDFPFVTEHFGKTIESQAATIEIATQALANYGWMALIIPSSTFTNEKDQRLVSFLHHNFQWAVHLTLFNAFKQEYGINIAIDLLIGRKSFERREPFRKTLSPDEFNELEHIIINGLDPYVNHFYPQYETITLPRLNKLQQFPLDLDLQITANGVFGNTLATALLRFYQETMKAFNPILGKQSGIYDACFSKAALAVFGPEKVEHQLKMFGFTPQISQNQKQVIERIQKRYKFESIPIYAPKSHQLLAYFDDRPYRAKATVYKDDLPLFIEGQMYHIRPQWIRQSQVVRTETKLDSKGKAFKQLTSLDRGYLSIEVKTEQGLMRFDEPDKDSIELFLKAFDLPKVTGIGEVYPERVAYYKQILEKRLPKLFDYQKEDVARLCLKNFGYLGYEMGGGKTISALAYAIARDFKRVLIICQSSLIDNWINEGKKFGIEIHRLTTHLSIDKLKTDHSPQQKFFITSYEFLSLNTARIYDPWQCIRYDKDGNIIHQEECRKRTCSKGHKHKDSVKACPKCGSVKFWSGQYCRQCHYSAYTYGEMRQYPAYKRIKKMFSCIIVDEAQLAKNQSGRGEAVRALKSKAKLILSGTIMKGYVTDVYHNFRWLLGSGTPLFPFPFRGGSKMFMDEYATYEMTSREFEETLTTGRRKLIPEVSNLNRFWRLIAPFTVRRTKDEMVKLPPKYVHLKVLPMDSDHSKVYQTYEAYAEQLIERELRKDEQDINMGIISAALWKLRFAATAPNDRSHLVNEQNAVSPAIYLPDTSYNKIQAVLKLVTEIRQKGEKVIIFSGLRSMQNNIVNALQRHHIPLLHVPSEVNTSKRFAAIETFSQNGHVALVTGLNVLNRGFTITCANHVIITDFEYSPEAHQQAEDRVHRTGQTKPVHVYYLLSQNTIDEHIYTIITQKKQAIEHAINGQAFYANTAQLLEQLDNRNVELAIARQLIEHKDKTAELMQAKIETSSEQIELETPAIETSIKKTDDHLSPATWWALKKRRARFQDPNQLDLFAA